jgi:hypothetical protein
MGGQKAHTECPVYAVHKAIFEVAFDIKVNVLIDFLVVEVVDVDLEHAEQPQGKHVFLLDRWAREAEGHHFEGLPQDALQDGPH